MANGAVLGILGGGKNVQSGTVEWNLSAATGVTLGTVAFPKAFSKTPKVLVQYTEGDLGDSACFLYGIYATDISSTGFTIFADSYLQGRSYTVSGICDWCAYEE